MKNIIKTILAFLSLPILLLGEILGWNDEAIKSIEPEI